MSETNFVLRKAQSMEKPYAATWTEALQAEDHYVSWKATDSHYKVVDLDTHGMDEALIEEVLPETIEGLIRNQAIIPQFYQRTKSGGYHFICEDKEAYLTYWVLVQHLCDLNCISGIEVKTQFRNYGNLKKNPFFIPLEDIKQSVSRRMFCYVGPETTVTTEEQDRLQELYTPNTRLPHADCPFNPDGNTDMTHAPVTVNENGWIHCHMDTCNKGIFLNVLMHGVPRNLIEEYAKKHYHWYWVREEFKRIARAKGVYRFFIEEYCRELYRYCVESEIGIEAPALVNTMFAPYYDLYLSTEGVWITGLGKVVVEKNLDLLLDTSPHLQYLSLDREATMKAIIKKSLPAKVSFHKMKYKTKIDPQLLEPTTEEMCAIESITLNEEEIRVITAEGLSPSDLEDRKRLTLIDKQKKALKTLKAKKRRIIKSGRDKEIEKGLEAEIRADYKFVTTACKKGGLSLKDVVYKLRGSGLEMCVAVSIKQNHGLAILSKTSPEDAVKNPIPRFDIRDGFDFRSIQKVPYPKIINVYKIYRKEFNHQNYMRVRKEGVLAAAEKAFKVIEKFEHGATLHQEHILTHLLASIWREVYGTTNPLLVITGVSGSGKSTATKIAANLLGQTVNIIDGLQPKNKVKAAYGSAVISNSSMILIDEGMKQKNPNIYLDVIAPSCFVKPLYHESFTAKNQSVNVVNNIDIPKQYDENIQFMRRATVLPHLSDIAEGTALKLAHSSPYLDDVPNEVTQACKDLLMVSWLILLSLGEDDLDQMGEFSDIMNIIREDYNTLFEEADEEDSDEAREEEAKAAMVKVAETLVNKKIERADRNNGGKATYHGRYVLGSKLGQVKAEMFQGKTDEEFLKWLNERGWAQIFNIDGLKIEAKRSGKSTLLLGFKIGRKYQDADIILS